MNHWKKALGTALIAALMLPLIAANHIWIEGEKPSNAPVLKKADGVEQVKGGKGYGFEGWGNTQMMSKGTVLHVNMSGKQAETYLPDEGLVFDYDFNVSKSADYNIWARIGYEWVRSDFQWRVDNGSWQTCERTTPTINIQPIQTWNELAWIKLGDSKLSTGKHKLQFKHYKYKVKGRRGKESTARILHMLDAICITPDKFTPAGKWEPGKDHRNALDKKAEANVFSINAKPGPDARAWTELDGPWQYAAWEETEFPISEKTRLQPDRQLPTLKELRWFGFNIPGGRDQALPEQGFAHRYLLRTKLNVPASLAGKSFFLDVQRSSLIVSVFVNGKFVDWTDTFHTAWQMDLSKYIQPGKENELVLCIKDEYYSLNPIDDASTKGLGNRRYWNLPNGFLRASQGTAGKHDYPCAADTRTGILEPASIVVAGPVYTEDVFCQPSVKKKELKLDVNVRNPAQKTVKATVENTVIPWNSGKGGSAQLTFAGKDISIPAGGTKTFEISKKWNNPTLWWPDKPYLYWVVTKVLIDGKVVDEKRTRFGFREWDWSTHMFVLNGVKWPMWADTNYGATPKQFVERSKTKSNQNQVRYWRHGGWGDMTRRECMNYFDETGMLVRSSGTFDGQLANYGGGLREPDKSQKPDKHGRYPMKAKTRLWDNWRKQMTAWIKEERNHPSIYIWSVENEVAYINVCNLGQWRECEPELTKGVQHVMKVDPTRPAMVDGGNCLRDESLPVNGAHYTEFMNKSFRDFPDAAYTREHFYDKNRPQRGAWRMVPNRPIMKGEVYFANGYSPDRFATIGGDKCFIGMGETMHARGLWGKMLSEGYRWAEVSSFHFWMGNSERQYWNSWSPVAVLCKQWNWTWGPEAKIDRTLKVFNSTSNPKPITVSWQLDVAGKKLAGAEKAFNVPCGEAEQFSISFTTPKVAKRTSAQLTLTAKRDGKEVFRDVKPVTILAPNQIAKPKISAKKLAVYDPKGSVASYLKKRGIGFTPVKQYGKIPAGAEVIVVGSNAIPADRSKDTLWLSLAAEGKRVLILDQSYPLAYQAVPGDIKPTDFTGRFGFSEDLTHPIFADLTQADFFTWGNDHVMYRNAYKKGSSGGRSLLQCDDRLSCTALFESQLNDGLFILSQLAIGDKLAKEGVAQQVFNNMLNYACDYRPIRKATYACLPQADERVKLMEKLKLKQTSVSDPLATLKDGAIAVIDATPANLKTLAASKDKVDAFCQSGGWLILWGLTPEGLKSFNTLTGYNQVLRKFQRERVLLTYPQDSLASGLTLRDVVMDTGKKMYPWMALKEPDQDAFTWLVDHTDIAPFCKFPTPVEMGKKSNDNPGVDHWPRNMVNGFTSNDNWCFTYTIIMDQGQKRKFTLELPKEEEIVALKLKPSKIYHPITKVNIYFDDDPNPVSATIPVKENPVVEDIPIKGRKAKKVTLEIADWTERGDKNIVVIDNLWLNVKRSEDYLKHVSSLLNVGALMAYRKGKGGIFLNQLNIKATEVNPDNVDKKSNIVKTLLKNMGAVFSGKKTEIEHSVFAYKPLKFPDSAFNAYVNQTGKPSWFTGGDIASIPVGERKYAGVEFFLSDFSTSPVPSVFMLRGPGSSTKDKVIKDLAVNTKADALFFLHTFNPGPDVERWKKKLAYAKQRKQKLPANPHVLSYIVMYEDGSKQEVKVQYKQHVGIWNDSAPLPLPGADLGWVGKQANGKPCAVWVMRWNNPTPDKKIKSITIADKGGHNLGAGAVFAISAGLKK